MANHKKSKDYLKEVEERFHKHVAELRQAVRTDFEKAKTFVVKEEQAVVAEAKEIRDEAVKLGKEAVKDVEIGLENTGRVIATGAELLKDGAVKLEKEAVKDVKFVAEKTGEVIATGAELLKDGAVELEREAVELGKEAVKDVEIVAEKTGEVIATGVELVKDGAVEAVKEVKVVARGALELGAEGIIKLEDGIVKLDHDAIRFAKRAHYVLFTEAPEFFEVTLDQLKEEKNPEVIIARTKAMLDRLGVPHTQVKFDRAKNHIDIHVPDAMQAAVMSLVMGSDLKLCGMQLKFNGPSK